MTTDKINSVIEKLKAGEVFFFAGSGISYASNLPSAYAVIKRTANVFLPVSVIDSEKEIICSTIQPEIFYESIVGMTRSYESLDIWRSLYRDEQQKHAIECAPSFPHLFIAEYSSKNNLPVITTNFDSMFEQACELLGINYRIVLPSQSPPDKTVNYLPICKVHGTIQDANGEYSPHALWTTMTQITKVNTRWIEYLNSLMTITHLCFVGYSGRDIDFFPYIAEFPKKSGSKNIIWINRFDGDHSDIASKSCDAIRIHLWPTEFFESISSDINIQDSVAIENSTYIEGDINALLNFLEKSLAAKRLLTDEEKELLYCGLLAKLGNYRDAHRYVTEIKESKLSQFRRSFNKHLVILTCARLSHEISRYESCKKYAQQVLAILKDEDEYDINSDLQASCLISEAYRMSLPNDIYFCQTKGLTDYLNVAFVAIQFIITSLKAKIKMAKNGMKYDDLNVDTQHELIEHRIRFYALIQSIFGSPQSGWNWLAKSFLIRMWDSIRDMSYQIGYSAGIANSGKFKYRLIPSDKIISESANIYSLTTSATGAELLVRNEADKFLRDGLYEQSRIKFIEYSNMAKKSGNILNEIKGIIGFAYANHMEEKTPLLTDSLRSRFHKLTPEVEGRRWRHHFAKMGTVFTNSKNT